MEGVSSFITTECKDKFHKYQKNVAKSLSKHSCELKLVTVDGSRFHAMIGSKLIKSADGHNRAIIVSIIDITDRILAENKIKDHEQFQKDILDAIQDGVSVLIAT